MHIYTNTYDRHTHGSSLCFRSFPMLPMPWVFIARISMHAGQHLCVTWIWILWYWISLQDCQAVEPTCLLSSPHLLCQRQPPLLQTYWLKTKERGCRLVKTVEIDRVSRSSEIEVLLAMLKPRWWPNYFKYWGHKSNKPQPNTTAGHWNFSTSQSNFFPSLLVLTDGLYLPGFVIYHGI